MQKIEIENRLNELKDCEKVKIITFDKSEFKVLYADIINQKEKEALYVKNDIFKNQEYFFLYCSISSIHPVS